MLTGYHFTAYHNWPSIRDNGLRISRITHTAFHRMATEYAGTAFGSWVFCEPPTDDRDFVGQLVFTMTQHKAPSVAFLQCKYEEDDSLREQIHENGFIPELTHTGSWGVYRDNRMEDEELYHEDKPCDIVLANIPPNRLSLIAVYGIQEIGNGD